MRKISILLIATIVFFATSCNVQLEVLTEAEGTVLNGMADGNQEKYWEDKDSGKSLEGAKIYLYKRKSDGTYSSSETAEATVNSKGEYSTDSGISDGWFKITGEKNGWTFVPKYVLINGEFSTIPPVVAYPDQGSKSLVIVLSWEDTDLDLDGVLTYFDGSERDYVGFLKEDTSSMANEAKIRTTGFSKNDYNYNTGVSSAPIELERDVTANTDDDIPRVETIVINWDDDAPYAGATTTTGDVYDDQLKYYVNSFNSTGGLTGLDDGSYQVSFSDAQVDVMIGSTHGGGWKLPHNTYEKILNVVNVTVTSTGYQVYSGNGSIYESAIDKHVMRSVNSDSVIVDVIK